MKYIYSLFLFIAPIIRYAQSKPIDSVSVRVYNHGKFYLKQYSIIIGEEKYTFDDIPKGAYSSFKKLPYIYINNRNSIEVQIIRKRFLQYDEWVKKSIMAIDHIGDKKIDSGAVTVNVSTKRRHHRIIIESIVK